MSVFTQSSLGIRRAVLIFVGSMVVFAQGCSKSETETSNEFGAGEPGRDSASEANPELEMGVVAETTPELTERLEPELTEEMRRFDPRVDGATTELLNQLIGEKLHEIEAYVASDSGETATLDGVLSEAFESSRLRPESLDVVFEEGAIRTLRARGALEEDLISMSAEDWGAQLRALGGSARESGRVRNQESIHFKVARIQWSALSELVSILAIVEYANFGETRRREQFAYWTMDWRTIGVDSELDVRLSRVRVTGFEEVNLDWSGPLLVDRSDEIFRDAPSFGAQMAVGLDEWRSRIDWRYTLESTSPHGLAIGDVNGDGLDDVFACEPGGLPNRLYLQRADGRVEDISAESGVDLMEPTYSALMVDLDNDGDQDLVLSSGRTILFYANDGKARFEQRNLAQTESMIRSMSAADYDEDGRLDIYACGYFKRMGDRSGLGRPIPYHDANNGAPNMLFHNEGNWEFEDVADQVGLGVHNSRFSYAAAWEDYDLDGRIDLYVANDFGRNNLYRNLGGRFEDVAGEAGVEDISAGMSVSWGDYNRDGVPDIYVSNMFSSAGNRIAYQRNYRQSDSSDTRSQYQRHARGNSLFRNNGDGTFEDVSFSEGVTMGRWAWGSNFVDLDNNGWEDLLVANGFITSPENSGDL